MRRGNGGLLVVVGENCALVLIIGSCLRSMPSAPTGVSLATIYRIENSIIYTYVLGQIYLGFLQLIAAESERPKTGS
ncbi:hypothetical protein CNECB9_4160005 [Cupriavidus necator]|uniref:Uncharacterized protein n=1 Tax=Cupriavidus necator TaxID=106590 RepID=A0A1K0JJ09_CUPNE|nr:hypothetical protein CNECB9_4160005 [Cupriavidus necator]